ncbi:MAG TPA: hypothetical protein VM223_16820 [Planctomycetota bacterium]|nr:hypothetical protein [Planctomycetota bacterium]
MSYEQFTQPKRQALAEGRLKLVRPVHRPLPQPAYVVQRQATCRACEHHLPDYNCRLWSGCGPCYLRRPLAVCPADPPQWRPASP